LAAFDGGEEGFGILRVHFARLTLAIVFFVPLAQDASAETVAQTVRKWGLIGTWSRDCSVAPGKDSLAVLSYAVAANDQVVHRRDFGSVQDENPVVTAEVLADGMLDLRVFFPGFKQTREYGLMRQPDGTVRTMYNHDQKDEYSIKDGKFSANGNPTPELHKCK
jgi:hypothetical protein